MTETKDLAADVLPRQTGVFYGGAWHDTVSGRRLESHNPADGSLLATVSEAGGADVDRAVAAAKDAFPAWAAMPPLARAAVVRQAAAKVREHTEELALLDSLDCGNPIKAMITDVNVGATFLDFFAGMATEIKGETIAMGAGKLNYVLREPLGVVARIVPFNHPIMFACMKIGAPLIAGNAVILKPSEYTPLSALRLAELIGGILPPGVFNVLTGGREAGEALSKHPDVDNVSLIGSVPTGRAVMRSAAATIKSVILELGGKNALIAYPDADAATVAVNAVKGMNFTWTAGQSCGATSRLFVHQSIHDQVVKLVAEGADRIRVGIPSDMNTEMGCLTSKPQFDKTISYIELAKSEGARLVAGGGRVEGEEFVDGFFIRPTVFADVTHDMRIAKEEGFGPVLSIIKWSDEEEMLNAVNDVEYGLVASIWTRDLNTALRAAARVRCGYIWVNGASDHFLGVPFGGYKQSGLGREECLGELLAYTQIKNVNVTLGVS